MEYGGGSERCRGLGNTTIIPPRNSPKPVQWTAEDSRPVRGRGDTTILPPLSSPKPRAVDSGLVVYNSVTASQERWIISLYRVGSQEINLCCHHCMHRRKVPINLRALFGGMFVRFLKSLDEQCPSNKTPTPSYIPRTRCVGPY